MEKTKIIYLTRHGTGHFCMITNMSVFDGSEYKRVLLRCHRLTSINLTGKKVRRRNVDCPDHNTQGGLV